MTLGEYQTEIDQMLKGYEKPYWHPLSQLARLIEEVGETARILNHKYGDKPKKINEELEELEDELADILYSVLCLANSQGIKLDEPLKRAISKLTTRDKDRFKKRSNP